MNSFEENNLLELLEVDGNIVVLGDMSVPSTDVAEETDDDCKLKEFLKNINMESIFGYLKASQVTYRSLPYLKKEDLKEAVPPLGLRVEFREKLFTWKKTEHGIDDDTMSIPSKMGEWWKRNETPATTTGSVCSRTGGVLSKDLKTLLSETSNGKLALEYYTEHKKLQTEHRDYIINIIIEDALNRDIVLCTQDYKRLLEEICSVFPHEREMKDYYYISRKGKNNASGKLYAKYRNKNLKKESFWILNQTLALLQVQRHYNRL